MKLEPIDLDVCQNLAKDLNEYDLFHNPTELSTWVYDPEMRHNCECFGIMVDNVIAGFVVLKDMNIDHSYLLWVSLHPEFRDGTIGAQATAAILEYAFVVKKAKMILSEVFIMNRKSMRLHHVLMSFRDRKKRLHGWKVACFGMNQDRWIRNLQHFNRYLRRGK